MVTNKEVIAVIIFFAIWVVILVPVFVISKKYDRKKTSKKSLNVPSDIKPASNRHKSLFMRVYIPSGMDPKSQKCAEAKLQICQSLYVSQGKITSIKEDENGKKVVTVKAGDVSFKIPHRLPGSVKVDDNVFCYYEKGLSGISRYVTSIPYHDPAEQKTKAN